MMLWYFFCKFRKIAVTVLADPENTLHIFGDMKRRSGIYRISGLVFKCESWE